MSEIQNIGSAIGKTALRRWVNQLRDRFSGKHDVEGLDSNARVDDYIPGARYADKVALDDEG